MFAGARMKSGLGALMVVNLATTSRLILSKYFREKLQRWCPPSSKSVLRYVTLQFVPTDGADSCGRKRPWLACSSLMTSSAFVMTLRSESSLYFLSVIPVTRVSYTISFPTQTFPSSMPTYRPPQAVRNASIRKVTASSSGEGFAALSENGELFLCTLSERSIREVGQQPGRDGQVKVQRVWALRKQFSAVKAST